MHYFNFHFEGHFKTNAPSIVYDKPKTVILEASCYMTKYVKCNIRWIVAESSVWLSVIT